MFYVCSAMIAIAMIGLLCKLAFYIIWLIKQKEYANATTLTLFVFGMVGCVGLFFTI